MSDTKTTFGWVDSTIADINFHKSANLTPKEHPDEIFELYSVPIFSTGSPEKISGKEIGSSKQQVEPNDVLLCKINPRINRVWDVKPKKDLRQIASSEWIIIRQPLISSHYLRYFLSSQEFRNLLCSDVSGVGGSLTRAQPKKVATYIVPIPPLAEQKEIAARLDDLLAQVDTVKARLDGLPNILKCFRQSVLAAAGSGKLTEEWRETGSFGKKMCIGDVASSIRYGTSKKCSVDHGDTPVLRIPNIGNGKIDLSELKYADFDEKELENLQLQEGDILLIRSNGSVELVGKAALIDDDSKHCLFAGYLIRVRVDSTVILPKYLLLCLQSPQMRKVIEIQARSTSGVNNINSKELAALTFIAPDINEQTKIVRRVEELFSFADQVERRVKEAQAQVNHLTQSILAKAFRGELTADWRANNPDLITAENSANSLLERIKAERKKQAKLNRRSGSSEPKRKPGSCMKPKKIIAIVDALKGVDKEVSAQQLLELSGYPRDADTETLERFFLDIRNSLDHEIISKIRKGNEDYFSLKT